MLSLRASFDKQQMYIGARFDCGRASVAIVAAPLFWSLPK